MVLLLNVDYALINKSQLTIEIFIYANTEGVINGVITIVAL